MDTTLPQQFIAALELLEARRDPGPIVALFADDARAGNVLTPEEFTGQDGAREFWTRYRQTFGSVQSRFRNVLGGSACAALEWETQGTTPNGEPLRYDGVSLLEYHDGKITRFRAYFDPTALGRQLQDERAASR